MKRVIVLLIVLLILPSLCAALFLVSPWGVTRLRIQNNLFRVESISVVEGADGIATVTQVIEAKNLLPWTVEVTGIGFHSKGEYSRLWSNETTELPFSLAPWEKREFSVTYQFDEAYFFSDYASYWVREMGAPSDPAACVEHFLRTDDFIFYSDDIPTGRAYCFTWNSNPAYDAE